MAENEGSAAKSILQEFQLGLEQQLSLVENMDDHQKAQAWEQWKQLSSMMQNMVAGKNKELQQHEADQLDAHTIEISLPPSSSVVEKQRPSEGDTNNESNKTVTEVGIVKAEHRMDQELLTEESTLSPPKKGGRRSKSARIVCQVCGKSLAHRSSYRTHMKIMHPHISLPRYTSTKEPKRYYCAKCGYEGSNQEEVKVHIQTEHKMQAVPENMVLIQDKTLDIESPPVMLSDKKIDVEVDVKNGRKLYLCKICKKGFSFRGNMLRHQRTHEGSKPHKCLFCPLTFTEKGSALKHMQRRHKESLKSQKLDEPYVYHCEECGKSCPTQGVLQVHQKMHKTGLHTFSCSQCQYESSLKSNLVRHMKQHGQTKAAVCKYCRLGFTSQDLLNQHHEQEHKEIDSEQLDRDKKKDHTCNICGKTFSTHGNMIVHQKIHSGDKPYTCGTCGKQFRAKSNLQRHEQCHSGVRPWRCKECNRSFTVKRCLIVHMRTHTGEKPHKCNVCGKQFAQLSSLRCHERIHTQQREYQCQICSKSFIQKSHLTLHLQRHEGKKMIDCPHCDMKFYRKADLDRHMPRHTGERPFLCQECPRTFTRAQYLTEHMNTHTGERPLTCKFCPQTFADHASLHRHVKLHTNLYEPTRKEVVKVIAPAAGSEMYEASSLNTHIEDMTSGAVVITDRGMESVSSESVLITDQVVTIEAVTHEQTLLAEGTTVEPREGLTVIENDGSGGHTQTVVIDASEIDETQSSVYSYLVKLAAESSGEPGQIVLVSTPEETSTQELS